jgi:aspartate carbamoyltransferase regulatory subunit
MVLALNVESNKYGKKDMIKIEGKYLTSREIDLISLVAPTVTINLIEDGRIKEKRKIELPVEIEGIFKCPNLSCVTNAEYEPPKTKFKVLQTDEVKNVTLRCLYCNSFLYSGSISEFLENTPFEGGLVSREKIKNSFLNVLLSKGALKIAPSLNELFMLKSGRQSPYFINIGALTDGESLSKMKWILASYVALLIEEGKIPGFDFVFGPAYKGINLSVLTCEGLNELYDMNKRYLYDRKEEKAYGDVTAEKLIVGADHFKPGQKILLIDDVITTGGTKIESIEKLKLLGRHEIVGLVLAVDRQEMMNDPSSVQAQSAASHIQDRLGIKVFTILNISTIFDLVKDNLPKEIKQYWINYYEKYGVKT